MEAGAPAPAQKTARSRPFPPPPQDLRSRSHSAGGAAAALATQCLASLLHGDAGDPEGHYRIEPPYAKDGKRRARQADPEPARPDVAARHELIHALVSDERGQGEELRRDEYLGPGARRAPREAGLLRSAR